MQSDVKVSQAFVVEDETTISEISVVGSDPVPHVVQRHLSPCIRRLVGEVDEQRDPSIRMDVVIVALADSDDWS